MSERREKFFIVDDSPADSELIEIILKKCNPCLETQLFKMGKETLNYLNVCDKENLPHVIILDINMPDINGLELLKMIKKQPKWQNIYTTLLIGSEDEKEFIAKTGTLPNFFLKKPNHPTELKTFSNQIKEILTHCS